MAIQNILINKLLMPLSRLTADWSDKKKDAVFIFCGVMLFAQCFLRGMGFAEYRFLIFYTIDCVFFGLMILCTLSADLQPVFFHKFPAFCWFGIGFLMLLSGVLVSENRFPEAMLFLVAYPVVFLVWNHLEHAKIFHLLSKTCIISFLPYILINILFYPMGETRYAGLMGNVNGAAFYLAQVFTCLLIELFSVRKVDKKYVAYMVLLGLDVALLYYTCSRTGYLQAIVTAATVLALYMLLHRKEKKIFLYRNVLVGCLTILICIPTALYLFQITKLFPEQAAEEDPVISTNPGTPETETKPNISSLEGVKERNDEKLSVSGKTLDQISSGRITVWKSFAENLNMLGHVDGDRYYVPILYREIETTHNTILQVAYDSGIPSGILYLLYNLFSGIAAIWYAVCNRDKPYSLFPFAITISFAVSSLLGSLTPSFYYMTTFYYYLVQFPLIARKAEPDNSRNCGNAKALNTVG